jgi:hypothetical protein
MNPQERQLVDDLFDRLAKLEDAPRDPEATAAIADGLRKAPNAIYALVQTALLQDEALRRANAHIQELEAAHPPQQQQSGGSFLDSMRDAIFGQSNQTQPRSSVPNVPPPGSRPVWNSGQVMQQAQPPGYGQAGYAPPPYGSSYGAPPFGGGGSFLGTAAAAAAGMVGGSLLLSGIRNMMGGPHYGFGAPTTVIEPTTAVEGDQKSPWSDQSGSALAQDAGINDIGNSRDHTGDDSRSGLLDQPSNDQDFDNDDRDDTDMDGDNNPDDNGDFGDDDGSNFA